MIIAEELSTHECRSLENYKIKDDMLFVSDGRDWYPLKLNNASQQRKNQHNQKFSPIVDNIKKHVLSLTSTIISIHKIRDK
jgi:hypothetical protein